MGQGSEEIKEAREMKEVDEVTEDRHTQRWRAGRLGERRGIPHFVRDDKVS
jgi:hypothetical protein